MWHRPLADLFNMLIDAGFRIERVAEPRDEPIPFILAIVAAKEAARV